MTKTEFEEYLNKNFPRTSSFFSGFSLFIVDIFVLVLCIALGFFIVNLFAIHDINFKSFINYTIFLPFVLLLFACMGLYPGIMIPAAEQVKKYSVSSFFGFFIIVSFYLTNYCLLFITLPAHTIPSMKNQKLKHKKHILMR